MGIKHSKNNIQNVTDYSIVTVPKNYTLLKIISYCIDLKTSANIDLKIADIISYIMGSIKNKKADIINLQGIYDILSLNLLIREIKQHCEDNNIKMYFAPDFEDIDAENNSDESRNKRRSKNLEDYATYGRKSKEYNEKTHSMTSNKKTINNIIISKYPIVGTVYVELDDKTNIDDVFGIQTVIGANILIGSIIVSVYNMCLCKDFRTSNIINDTVRATEIQTLNEALEKNKQVMNGIEYEKYTKSNIHLIIGNLNIPEIANDNINIEYINLMKNMNCIDLFRYKFPKDFGYTTTYKERLSYILLHVAKETFDEIETIEHTDVLNLLFKKYKIHVMDMYVVDNNKKLINMPIECIFMLKTN